jgi:hypothetical protein
VSHILDGTDRAGMATKPYCGGRGRGRCVALAARKEH